jgi:predicted nucleic acid-binding protein
MAFVLDASVALGWTLDKPTPSRAAEAQRHMLGGEVAVVPDLWLQEVANAVVMSERRGRLTAGELTIAVADLEDIAAVVEIDRLLVGITTLIEIARDANLTVYDAVYLELASRRRLPLATLDDMLGKAARRAGLRVI